jgi:hypothetical protein
MVVDARPGAPKLPGSSSGGCRSAPQLLLSSLLTLARPRHPIRVSGKRWSSDPRSGLLGARLDRFRVRAEPLLGNGMSVASAACGGSLMFATVCAGWPTVWPTASRLTSVGSTAAPASSRSRASDRAHWCIASAVEMSTRAEPGNMAALASRRGWALRDVDQPLTNSDQVCQTGHYANRDLGELLAPTLAL